MQVADFNLSKFMEQSLLSTLGASNPRWLAAELLLGERASPASDVFSFGVVMWELLTWEVPWSGQRSTWMVRSEAATAASSYPNPTLILP